MNSYGKPVATALLVASLVHTAISRIARVLVVTLLAFFSARHATAQMGANHSTIWTSGDIVYIDAVIGSDLPRASTPGQGTFGQPYASVSFAVADVFLNPRFPVVFNVMDLVGLGATHFVSNLNLPAYGVKLQTLTNSTIVLDGGGASSPVLYVNSEGQRFFSDGSLMPATIIQGFTITHGGYGVRLDVATAGSAKPLRTEIRDCFITQNKFLNVAYVGSTPYWGGVGIRIDSYGGVPTQYVIEQNEIYDQADFFPGHIGPASYGIWIVGRPNARESTLIRGNRLHQQETGIGIYGHPPSNAWVRPRILSNFLWDHEQHVWSVGDCGPILYNDTVFRARDYCLGPDRHVIHHAATPTPVGSNPEKERTAMIVRNCIFDYTPVPPITPGGPPVFPPVWPVDTFCGGGTVEVSWTDFETITGIVPTNDVVANLRQGPGNFFSRTIPFVSIGAVADLHLITPALMVESGDLVSIQPGQTIVLDQDQLPSDVRTDVDGDVRVSDFDRNGVLVPDRGGDEVFSAGQFGMRLSSTADRTGNVPAGATVTFTIQGVPNDLALLMGWLDCSTDTADDVIYNDLITQPFGNQLLPQCGLVNGSILVLNAQGQATVQLTLSGAVETQAYFQAIGLSQTGNPAPGCASNRVRIELN